MNTHESFQQKDLVHLIKLLDKLKRAGLGTPNMPRAVWQAFHGLVPLPAVEVIISQTGKDFLLTYRKDEYWDGWHIPGGFIVCGETVGGSCDRIAKRELGIEVTLERLITAYMWPDHPYADALSLVCLCSARDAPKKGTFFTDMPDNMVPYHRDFINAFLNNVGIHVRRDTL